MTKFKSKLIVLLIVFILGIVALQVTANASNENIEIIKKSESDYLIYIKDNLDSDFEFTFSNNKDGNDLTFDKKAGLDSKPENPNANKIAYINSLTIGLFENPTYMWAKNEKGYIVEGIEIDLSKAISSAELEEISNVTKIIPVDLTKTNTTEKEVDNKKIITTLGKVVLEEGKYQYILVKLSNSEEYDELLNLLTRISKFNKDTDMYTKVGVYNKFYKLYENLKPTNQSNWIDVENNEILQPDDTKDGEQYILWLKEDNETNSKIDIQFLTSTRQETEEKIVEKITTKLPVTYDNNILLIVLVILIVAIVIVALRIKSLSKKEEK